MSGPSRRIVEFRGGVSCRRDPDSPLGITLTGRTGAADEVATLAFATAATSNLPEVLENACVEQIDTNRFRIVTGRQQWVIDARAVHLHRDVSTVFYRAIAPRVVPWPRKIFWQFVLALAAHPLGKRVLRALRRR